MRFTMSKILILVLLTACSSPDGPFKNGVYKSVGASDRQGFFLEIEGQKASLYGWDVTFEGDTIYYKTSTRFEQNDILRFENFGSSKVAFNWQALSSFQPPESDSTMPFYYNSLDNISQIGNRISLSASQPLYNSKSDTFEFELVE